MEIYYQPTFTEFWQGNRYSLRKMTGSLLWIGALLLMAFVLSPWLFTEPYTNDRPLDIYLNNWALLILPGILSSLFLTTYFGAKKLWATSAKVNGGRYIRFEEQGLRMKGDAYETFYKWNEFAKVERFKDLVYMELNTRQFIFFPLKLVSEPEALESLLRQKVPNVKGWQ